MAELGSWDAVHADERYLSDVQPFWDSYDYVGGSCGNFPQLIPGLMAGGRGLCCWQGK